MKLIARITVFIDPKQTQFYLPSRDKTKCIVVTETDAELTAQLIDISSISEDILRERYADPIDDVRATQGLTTMYKLPKSDTLDHSQMTAAHALAL